LFCCLLQGNSAYVKILLAKGADWNDKDNDGQTALHLATRHRSPRCLSLLLKQLQPGAVDDQDNSKVTVSLVFINMTVSLIFISMAVSIIFISMVR